MTDRISLFWKTTTTPMTKAEFEVWRSPEQTGKRLVEHVTTGLKRSLDKLPAECRDWFRVDFERPYWIDPEIPQQALHELQRLTIKMPDVLPDWWTLDREQQRAAEVLMAVRETIHATHGMDPPRTLALIEMTIHLGFSLAQAHIEPWEIRVGHRLAVNQDAGKRAGEKKRQQAQERIAKAREHWEGLNQPERDKASIVAKKMGVAPRTVRRWRNQGWKLEEK